MIKNIKLLIIKSNNHITVQLISLSNMNIILTVSTLDKSIFPNLKYATVKDAITLGKLFSIRSKSMGIYRINSYNKKYNYHGKIKAFFESTKQNGIVYKK